MADDSANDEALKTSSAVPSQGNDSQPSCMRQRLGKILAPLHIDCATMQLQSRPSSWKELQLNGGTISEQYRVLEAIGRGSVGFVHRAIRKADSQEVAMKTVCIPDLELVSVLKEEYSLLVSVEHPHIIRALDFQADGRHAVLIMEFFSGLPLGKVVSKSPGKTLPHAVGRHLFFQLLQALNHLHQKNIVHRDVRVGNILVSPDLQNLKLKSFDTARRLSEGEALSVTGTCARWVPEILLGESPSESSDVWCAGLVLYYMFVGRSPWRQAHYDSMEDFKTVVTEQPVKLPESRRHEMSEQCEAIIAQCLEIDASRRPTAAMLLSNEWFAGRCSGGCAPTPMRNSVRRNEALHRNASWCKAEKSRLAFCEM